MAGRSMKLWIHEATTSGQQQTGSNGASSPVSHNVYALNGRESLSDLFDYDVYLVETAPLADSDFLGVDATAQIQLDGQTPSSLYFNGIITQFEALGKDWASTDDKAYYRYRLTLSPKVWLLGQNRRCAIYQNMSALDIVKVILGQYTADYTISASGSYKAYKQCVQYQESDLDFIGRLMEREGLSFRFVQPTDTTSKGKPLDRKSTRLNSSHSDRSRMPSSA